eukprot:10631514-Karenia_brevis.AAC.1
MKSEGSKRQRESASSRNPRKGKEAKRNVFPPEVKEEPVSSNRHRYHLMRCVENVPAAKRLRKDDVEVGAPAEDEEAVKRMTKSRESDAESSMYEPE